MRRVRSVCIAAPLALAMLVAPSANAGQPVKVFATDASEFGQSAVNGAIAWALHRTPRGFDYEVRVKLGTASAFRVNPARTVATMGGLDLGNPLANVLLAYDRSRAIRQKQWDVRLFDVETRTHLAVPGGINTTSKREGRPSVSGDYLLFERGPQRWGAGTKIVLYRFSTSSSTIIGAAPDVGWVSAGQVSGGYATYHVCPRSLQCTVFRYDIGTQQRVRAPDAGRATYDASVTDDGVVFYVLGSPERCGYKTRLMRWDGSGAATTVASFDNGVELAHTSAHVEPDGDEIVHFTRVVCRTSRADIYRVKV